MARPGQVRTPEEKARINLNARRRKNKLSLFRMAHRMHVRSGMEVFVVIHHHNEDRYRLYTSQPGVDWPPPLEKLEMSYPVPEIWTPDNIVPLYLASPSVPVPAPLPTLNPVPNFTGRGLRAGHGDRPLTHHQTTEAITNGRAVEVAVLRQAAPVVPGQDTPVIGPPEPASSTGPTTSATRARALGLGIGDQIREFEEDDDTDNDFEFDNSDLDSTDEDDQDENMGFSDVQDATADTPDASARSGEEYRQTPGREEPMESREALEEPPRLSSAPHLRPIVVELPQRQCLSSPIVFRDDTPAMSPCTPSPPPGQGKEPYYDSRGLALRLGNLGLATPRPTPRKVKVPMVPTTPTPRKAAAGEIARRARPAWADYSPVAGGVEKTWLTQRRGQSGKFTSGRQSGASGV